MNSDGFDEPSAEGRQSRVDDFDAQLDRLQATQRSEPGSTVRVQLDFDAVGVLKHDRHQRFYPFRREQTSGILETEPIYFERRRVAGALREILIGVFGRDGINDVGNRIDADVTGYLRFPRPTFQLVPLFGNARFADAVGSHPFHEEAIHRPRGEVEGAKAAGVQPERRARNPLAHQPHTRPRIFLQLPDALLQVRAGDQLDGVKACAIHRFRHRQHHAGGHILRP